jgi:hypothetical protein
MAVSSPSIQSADFASATGASLYNKLNSVWHERALQVFLFIVLAHWAEHLVQAYQIWVLGWPRPMANGVLGLWYPWLIKSEVLHYLYALVMLIGIWVLRKGFSGRARTWWTIALVIQFWHHIEHLLLIARDLASQFGRQAGADERAAILFPTRRAASFLQLDRVHSDGDRHVLPHVPGGGRGEPRYLHLRLEQEFEEG